MSLRYLRYLTLAMAVFVLSCGTDSRNISTPERGASETGPAENLVLAQPYATPSAQNRSKGIGWPPGRLPTAPSGFTVSLFAEKLDNPRWTYQLPNGDVLAVDSIRESPNRPEEKSANRITLFRNTNKDGRPDQRETFLTGLNMPFGMLLLGDWFYVGNTNGLVRYPYRSGQTRIEAKGESILPLPAGGHFTRNIIADPSGKKLYIAVGSTGNIDEDKRDSNDPRRAAILEVNPNGSGMRVFAGGLRNPVGMDWEAKTNVLWTVVNERDGLGDETPPDYLTSVRDGGFYGWPYCYWGQTVDDRVPQDPAAVSRAITPDYALGGHTASLGLCWLPAGTLPGFPVGMAIGQHGSWNRSTLSGYKVIFVPFADGRPSGPPRDILTGFLAPDERESYGRPVGVAIGPDGSSLLVADDVGDVIWRVSGIDPR